MRRDVDTLYDLPDFGDLCDVYGLAIASVLTLVCPLRK